jgi:preprotein translocase subunit SecG
MYQFFVKKAAIMGFPAVIITTAVILAISSMWNDSLTFDEVPHIAAGYSYLTTREMRLNPEHPVLFKDLAAVPLVTSFVQPIDTTVFSQPSWTENHNDQWQFGKTFLFESENDTTTITRATRIPLLIFFIGAAILLYTWTKKRYGTTASFIALFAFCFSPTVLAHGRLVTNDVAVLFGVLASIYFFIRFLHSPTIRRTIIAGIFLGIALITKFSAVVLLPFFVVLILVHALTSETSRLQQLKKYLLKLLLLFAIACFGIIYPLYAFHISSYTPEKQHRDTQAILKDAHNIFYPIVWSSDKSVLRPLSQYALGVAMNSIRTKGGNTHYYLGTVGTETHISYFPLLYSLKETVPWLLLLTISLCYGIFRTIALGRQVYLQQSAFSIRSYIHSHIDEVSMLAWILLYGAVSVFGNLNIGLRHLLPIYPFIIILVAAGITYTLRKISSYSYKQFGYGVLVVLLAWHVVEALAVFPSYLSYFNEFAGGSKNGHKYVTDSNVDWGQDILRLKQWVDSQSTVDTVEADLFTSSDPAYYLKDSYTPLRRDEYSSPEDFKERRKSPHSAIAISYTILRDAWATDTGYEWLKNIEPTTVIGNSIAIYTF